MIATILEEAADRINALKAENLDLKMRIHDAYEVYAGMEGIPVPETCCEAYLLQIIHDIVGELKR